MIFNVLNALIFYLMTAFCLAQINQRIDLKGLHSKEVYLAPPEYVEHFTFGFQEVLSDSIWLRWIQSHDICGKTRIKKSTLEKKEVNLSKHLTNEVGASKKFGRRSDKAILQDIIEFTGEKDLCEKGWSFQLLDVITTLTPKFELPYNVGAITLSVFAEDPEGAAIIFERGMKQFPDSWKLHYRAAYHYLYEMKDFDKAALLMDKAAELGAPTWAKSLASRLYTASGQAYLGLVTLKSYLNQIDHPERRRDIEKRIHQLQAIVDQEKQKELKKSSQ